MTLETSRRRVAGAGWSLLVVLTFVIALPRPASAHATLLQTVPADEAVVEQAPGAVELRFNEAVQASTGGITVFGPDGDRVDRGSVEGVAGNTVLRLRVDADGPGTHTVAWRVTSEDGHTIAGSFVFHVQRKTGAVEIDDSTAPSVLVTGYAGRWLVFAGTLLVLGALVFRRLGGTGPEVDRRLRRLAVWAAGAATVGAAVTLVAAAAEAGGRRLPEGFSLVGDFVADQRTGLLGALRVAALVLVTGTVAIEPVWRRLPGLAGIMTGAALVTTTLGGHAWTTSPRWGAVASDLVHLGAVALWAGGLVALLVALPVLPDPGAAARRFSTLAVGAVAVVAVSGSISGWAQVRALDGLTSTTYGRLLLGKIAGFAILVAIGWRNRTRLVALVERTATPLIRSVRAEVVVAALVVLLTTGLVAAPPARTSLSRPFATTVTEAGGTLDISVEPARAGANDIHLYFFDPAGSMPATVDAVEIQAATVSIPPRRLTVTPVSPNHVSAYSASLPSPGTWTLSVTAVQADTTTTFTVEVPIR